MRGWFVWATCGLLLGGCTSVPTRQRVASTGETMCKHCNCLMPASIDPEALCPVCTCGHKARECVRGH